MPTVAMVSNICACRCEAASHAGCLDAVASTQRITLPRCGSMREKNASRRALVMGVVVIFLNLEFFSRHAPHDAQQAGDRFGVLRENRVRVLWRAQAAVRRRS